MGRLVADVLLSGIALADSELGVEVMVETVVARAQPESDDLFGRAPPKLYTKCVLS
jgi:hypothetical protein